ncbi:hypothetical protein MYSTI_05133 [Myxococcus stipitatus DSM 14675]|uniref:DUF72 domain-containing protein n=1 Tax=Myxococcus stipitatus (strain DSM 14675 / JCM 12634 / Mx s8) TaxID=1278073 RepID=L7UF01_MYXSD|nr:DUF72 domain-containing protein [Myxococcus stipitatus]AGC46420.1 hypothetical protein MYSTI_05133 [Myxococcus stipitatus DSM 14675]
MAPQRGPSQLDLFTGAPVEAPSRGRGRAQPVEPAPVPEALATLGHELPQGIYLGTSSWTFPGWNGLVFDHEATASQLAREGLSAYSRHPVLRTVGVDRTFYGPVTAETFAEYAEQVPSDFRFLVKAHEACTLARFPTHERYGAQRGQLNERFLNAAYAEEFVVRPFVEGLGDKGGPLVFQFPPQDPQVLGGVARFVERLHAFLSALPKGPLYAVEVRNEELLTEGFAQALADVGASPVLAIWAHMPNMGLQAKRTRALEARALVVRWMLPPNLGYEEARARYAPFNRLVDEDVPTRDLLARACLAGLRRERPVFVTINNKAEGSAPLSAIKLAERIVSGKAQEGSQRSVAS